MAICLKTWGRRHTGLGSENSRWHLKSSVNAKMAVAMDLLME